MNNILTKNLTVSYVPGSPYVPADPGQPYLPAGTRTYTEKVCAYERVLTQAKVLGYDELGNAVVLTNFETKYVCKDVVKTAYFPSQPYIPPTPPQEARPSTMEQDFNLGWNSGARSEALLVGDGAFSFQVSPSAVGVVVGLNTQDTGYGYREIAHSFYLSHGIAKIMELGTIGQHLGPFTADTVFSVQRIGETVRYLVDGVEVFEAEATVSGPVFLDVSLYSGGDMLFNPALSALSGAAGVMQPLTGVASDYAYNAAFGAFHPLTSEAGEYKRTYGEFLPLQGFASDRPMGQVVSTMLPLTGSAGVVVEADLEPSYAVAQGAFAFMVGSASGLTGTVGSVVDAPMAPLMGLSSDRPYGYSAGTMAPMTGFSHAYEGPNEANIASVAFAVPYVTVAGVLAVTMNSVGQVTSIMQVSLEQQADLISTAQVQTPMELDSALEAAMFSVLNARTSLGGPEDADTCWVLNVDNMASSRYENYGFNSFGMFQGRYVGVRQDGVYLLEGDTDDGDPIRAMISLGKQTFGTTQLKGLQCAYLGVASDDRMYLKVLVNEQEYIYEARRSDDYTRTQRIDTGKGLRANVYEFEIYNNEGCDFDLDSVEFVPVTFNRRI
ncbi:MAG: hypothetical protein WBI41_05965 [Azovibrio sp.]|uniref:hypothetical protein n=1 Tax=Azovibrio sp. TaxID=1872673 RepID=UPI003C708D24